MLGKVVIFHYITSTRKSAHVSQFYNLEISPMFQNLILNLSLTKINFLQKKLSASFRKTLSDDKELKDLIKFYIHTTLVLANYSKIGNRQVSLYAQHLAYKKRKSSILSYKAQKSIPTI